MLDKMVKPNFKVGASHPSALMCNANRTRWGILDHEISKIHTRKDEKWWNNIFQCI